MGLFVRVTDDGPSKPGVPSSSLGGRAFFGQIFDIPTIDALVIEAGQLAYDRRTEDEDLG